MPIRYASDSKGPYDALQTILDGKGKWWAGMDPVDLYGYQHTTDCSNQQCNTSPYGTQFMYRVDEAIDKYHPDVVYFDDHAGDSQVDLGVHMGLGSIATTILANYYNKSLTWNQGKMDVVMNMKGVGGQYDSFQDNEALVPYVQRALVRSTEASTEPQISAYPFQTELDIQSGNWHYLTGAGYTDAATLVDHADAERVPKRKPVAEPHAARPGEPRFPVHSNCPGHRCLVEGQRRSRVRVPSVRSVWRCLRQHSNRGLYPQQRERVRDAVRLERRRHLAPGSEVGRGDRRVPCPRSRCSARTWR